jgi:hypothetical protein
MKFQWKRLVCFVGFIPALFLSVVIQLPLTFLFCEKIDCDWVDRWMRWGGFWDGEMH